MPTPTDTRAAEDMPPGAPFNEPVEIRAIPAWEARAGLVLLVLLVVTCVTGTVIISTRLWTIAQVLSERSTWQRTPEQSPTSPPTGR